MRPKSGRPLASVGLTSYSPETMRPPPSGSRASAGSGTLNVVKSEGRAHGQAVHLQASLAQPPAVHGKDDHGGAGDAAHVLGAGGGDTRHQVHDAVIDAGRRDGADDVARQRLLALDVLYVDHRRLAG